MKLQRLPVLWLQMLPVNCTRVSRSTEPSPEQSFPAQINCPIRPGTSGLTMGFEYA